MTEGHPDKIADQISDAVLDAVLSADPTGRVACETLITTGLVVLAGEISTSASVDYAQVARDTICEIGYDRPELGFDGHSCGVLVVLDRQSPDIAQGVDHSAESRATAAGDDFDRAGAGDQGMMFGYATNETPELMPMPIALAHRLSRRLAEVRRDGTLPYLRPDGKTQVTVRYRDSVPVAIEKVVISTQHAETVERDQIEADLWEHVVGTALPAELYSAAALRENLYVNPTGRFVIGGPAGYAGLTGRKIIVDTYGGYADMAAARSAARIPPRWTHPPPTLPATWPERRLRRPRRPNRGAGRLRHRHGPPALDPHRDLRYRARFPLGHREARARALRPTPAGSRDTSVSTDPSIAPPPPMAVRPGRVQLGADGQGDRPS